MKPANSEKYSDEELAAMVFTYGHRYYKINGERVDKLRFWRLKARALEAENSRLHEKLAKIYELI